ncbi:hypothetical protein MNBD_UNCLBAC01-1093 [hydrothermal vent metagenome]|uniref:VanZ-like domain-containing protein n=1 Tax=hydrothermal vent metagenome TaxID=652676 RepID=A0A3B1D7T3_9ZZZZ
MVFEKNRQNYYVPITIIYMGILAYLQLRNPLGNNNAGISSVKQLLHNLAHIPAYAVLAWLVLKFFFKVDFRAKIYATVIASAYGILMELLQSLAPGRFASLGDVFLNTFGILIIILWSREKKI